MDDPVLKAKQLQEKALIRSQERLQAQKEQRLRQWQEIQTKAPDLALFLIAMNKVFGKPASLKVEFREHPINLTITGEGSNEIGK
mgnify:FL=1